jgi:hypothetical protein
MVMGKRGPRILFFLKCQSNKGVLLKELLSLIGRASSMKDGVLIISGSEPTSYGAFLHWSETRRWH